MSKAPHESADPLERENWRRNEKKALELDAAISALDSAIGDALPVGVVIPWPNSTAPTGWMLCDGSAVSRTTYADLYAACGTTYGSGDGSTTFNIPDLRGRTVVGVDGAAARLAANDALGNSGGTETHTLTTAEMPAHTHAPSSKSFALTDNIAQLGAGLVSAAVNAVSSVTGSTGGGGAHNNMQPFQVLNWIIKALPSGDDSLVIVAGDGLTASGGALAVNVDNTTIGITADAIYVKADGIGSSQIAADAVGASELADNSVASANIIDGSIVNADVNAAAAIDATKIHDGSISNTEFGYLNGVTSAIQTQIDGKQASDSDLTAIAALAPSNDDVIQRKAGAWTNRTMAQLATDLDAAGLATDTALTTHESDTSSVHGITDTTKQVPVKIFQPGARTLVQAATTANITLSGAQTVDTVALIAGDKCLVKDQTTASENGVYTVAAGAWTRHADADTADEVYTGIVLVSGGATNGSKMFVTSNLTPPSIGVDTVTYVEMNSALSGVDTTPANRFALDLLSFLEGNHSLQGSWEIVTLSVGSLTASFANIASIDDGAAVTVLMTTTDGDGTTGMGVYDYAAATNMYMSGSGKISTDSDVDLELKSGVGSSTNQGTVYLNGGHRRKAVYKTANYSMDHGDEFVGYTTLAAAREVRLPLKSSIGNGQKCTVADLTTGTHADTNNITVKEHATDGGSTVGTINLANGRMDFELQNGDWWCGPQVAWTRTA